MAGIPSLLGPPEKISLRGIDRLLKSVFHPLVLKRAFLSSSSPPKSGVGVPVGHGVSSGTSAAAGSGVPPLPEDAESDCRSANTSVDGCRYSPEPRLRRPRTGLRTGGGSHGDNHCHEEPLLGEAGEAAAGRGGVVGLGVGRKRVHVLHSEADCSQGLTFSITHACLQV